MVIWDSSPPPSQSAGFPNGHYSLPQHLSLDLLACGSEKQYKLGLSNIINNLKKEPGPDTISVRFYQTYKENAMLIL